MREGDFGFADVIHHVHFKTLEKDRSEVLLRGAEAALFVGWIAMASGGRWNLFPRTISVRDLHSE